jgi:hypothetical protein
VPLVSANVPQKKTFNPFYGALVAVGIAFAITACAYGVMTVRMLDPRAADEGGMAALMDRHGLKLLVGEIALLAVLTFAAIGSDDYFTRRAERANAANRPDDSDRPR